jgi:hypothetical protein
MTAGTGPHRNDGIDASGFRFLGVRERDDVVKNDDAAVVRASCELRRVAVTGDEHRHLVF